MCYNKHNHLSDFRDGLIASFLGYVHAALQERGYNPAGQLVRYILSEDLNYITTYNDARILVRRINRNELLQEIVENCFAEDCDIKAVTHF